MTKLETLHRQILKELKRIEGLNKTKWIDPELFKKELAEAKARKDELQKEFDAEYESENN